MIRVAVEDTVGNVQVVTVDATPIAADLRDAIEERIAAAAHRTGIPEQQLGLAMLAELVQRIHDQLAYSREAARRGVLPL